MQLAKTFAVALLILAGLCAASAAQAQPAADARQVVTRAAEALGGVERIQAIRTMRLRGYGHDQYQDGGSLITTEPTAPEKMTIITAYERVIDLANGRTRVRAKQSRAFVFAAQAMMEGRPIDQALDGDVAFDVALGGAARRLTSEVATRRRMELLANPIVAVRAALDSRSRVTNRRTEGAASIVDVSTASGDTFALAVTTSTGLPLWMRWVGPHENLGDLTYRAEFSGYEPVNGVWVPMSFNVVSDFKDNVQLRLHVDRYVLDGDVGDLAAPAAVRSAPEPVPVYTVDASPIVPGVWLLSGAGGANSVLLEFENHLSLFEVPTSRAWTAALIDKARATVPGKPVTEAIISHHHFDHTGGLRTAIAEGLTIVTQAGNVAWFEDLAHRRVEAFPDALSRNPQAIKTRAVDDHLRLSDSKLTVDVYRVVSNNHMAHGLLAYVPEHRLLIQGDLFDLNWEVYFWGNTYEDNVAYRKLDVERDVPIHGRVLPIAEVRAKLVEQTRNAEQLCARVESAGLSMPGCPLAWED
jgi:glyoxylase-like metal-dependent hydrolase (beta-lactamase superfamily II)